MNLKLTCKYKPRLIVRVVAPRVDAELLPAGLLLLLTTELRSGAEFREIILFPDKLFAVVLPDHANLVKEPIL